MKKVRIFLADDHPVLRAGIRHLIEKNADFKIVGEAGNGQEALDALKSMSCDLLIMDLLMPKMNGFEAIKKIRIKSPKTKVLVLTMQKDPFIYKEAVKLGVGGYVLKDDALSELETAIGMICGGEHFVSAKLRPLMRGIYSSLSVKPEKNKNRVITRREEEVLRLIAQGMANKNVATKLRISIRTAETHRANLMHKLGIKSTADLVKYAISEQLF